MTCNRLETEGMLAELGSALDAHVEGCEECRARVRGYQQLADLVAGGVTARHAPPDWKQRTLARVRAAQRVQRRRRVATVAGFAAAAAIVVILVLRVRAPSELIDAPKLAMQITDQGGWRGQAHPGEEVRARAAPARAPHFEIRVYRGARDLLVRCPVAAPPVCREPDRSLLVWEIPSVGTYQVVFLVSQQPIAAPRGSLDDDVGAATAAGARVVDVQVLHVH